MIFVITSLLKCELCVDCIATAATSECIFSELYTLLSKCTVRLTLKAATEVLSACWHLARMYLACLLWSQPGHSTCVVEQDSLYLYRYADVITFLRRYIKHNFGLCF